MVCGVHLRYRACYYGTAQIVDWTRNRMSIQPLITHERALRIVASRGSTQDGTTVGDRSTIKCMMQRQPFERSAAECFPGEGIAVCIGNRRYGHAKTRRQLRPIIISSGPHPCCDDCARVGRRSRGDSTFPEYHRSNAIL
jgi:hypothetical protein